MSDDKTVGLNDAPAKATRAPRKTDRAAEGRARRVPMTGAEANFYVPPGLREDGYEYRWANDRGSRVQRLEQAGYEVVTDAAVQTARSGAENDRTDGTVIRAQADKSGRMDGMQAVLMRQRSEFYQEDQATKQGRIDQVVEAINGQGLEIDNRSGTYVPKAEPA